MTALDKLQRSTTDKFIFSHSGAKLGLGYPASSIEDIAVSLGRICRFAGHCTRFWSVLQHSMIVADLCQPKDKPAAYLHDSCEIMLGDIPTPFKLPEMKTLENKLLASIFEEHLTQEQIDDFHAGGYARIKAADQEAFVGEVYVVGNQALRSIVPERSKKAEKLVRKYLKYSFDDLLRPDGNAVLDFIRKAAK